MSQGADDQSTAGEADDRASDADREHLEGVEDGCGCAEVWEHLSEQREAEAGSD